VNVVSGTILAVLLAVVVCGTRRWALLAMLTGTFFLTQGHSLDVASLNIFPARFLASAAFARVLLRRELSWSRLNKLDWTLLITYNYTALVWILRSSDRSAEQFAFAVDPTLCYLALRGLLAEVNDFGWLLVSFAPFLLLFTVLVALERVSGHSSFEVVGANWGTYMRNAVPRCSGSFRHATLLGSIAAAFLALYVALFSQRAHRIQAGVGVVSCLSLIVLSNSGGPLTSTLAALAGWLVWPFRTRMRLVRYAVLGVLVALIFCMEAPIWYLPFKVSQVVGGGGYHRGQIMQSAWNDIGRWWLVGMELRDTLPWIPYAHGETGGADITNGFVTIAIKGGLLALILWIGILSRAFARVGDGLKGFRPSRPNGRDMEALIWGLGVALLVHAVSWLGIAYFDQSWVIWLMHVAAVSTLVTGAANVSDVTALGGTPASVLTPRKHAVILPADVATPARVMAGRHGRFGERARRRA
jgi:hypothetical protein